MDHFIFQPIDENTCMAVSYDGRDETVVIPPVYNGMKVVMLYCGLFSGHSEIRKVLLPPGLQYIESEAFKDCPGLTSLRLPNTLEYIGHYAFTGSGLEIMEIPGSIPDIGPYAFKDCTSLTAVIIRKGVKKIQAFAFEGCTSLVVAAVPSDIEISHDAFNGCIMLNTDLKKKFVSTCNCPACTGAKKIQKPKKDLVRDYVQGRKK